MEELTIEQLRARLATVESEKADAQAKASAALAEKDAVKAEAEKLHAENKKLSAVVDAVEEEKAKTAPVSFDVEDDGTYEFTCPTFTWDDGSVINVRELANSKVEKDQDKYATICAHLVARESGIVRRKEN
jgi:hypothetical protein